MYTFRSSPQGRHHFQAFHSVPISQNSRTTVYLLVKSRHLQKPILKLLIRVFTIVKTSVLIRHDAGLLNSAHQPWIHSENPTQDTDVIWFAPHPLGVEIQLRLLVSACISFLATGGTAQTELWVLPKTPRFTPFLSHSEWGVLALCFVFRSVVCLFLHLF